MLISPTAMSELAAHAIYESSDDRECRYLHLEWLVDFFVAADLDAHFKMAADSYDWLRARGHDEDNQFEYNDLDCHAFTVPWKTEHAFAHKDQNSNYVYVLSESENLSELYRALGKRRNLRIYQYWDMKPENPDDDHGGEYSDCPDGEYGYGPDRPTLEWLIENDGTKYGDSRDQAFIVRTPGVMGISRDTIYKLQQVRWAIFNINSLWTILGEEDESKKKE